MSSLSLNTLKNPCRPHKNRKRVGRGVGSGLGKTSGRGEKGAGSRSGYKRPKGAEGGQWPLYRKVPIRGFSRGRFLRRLDVINLRQIEVMLEELKMNGLLTGAQVVDLQWLCDRGFLSGQSFGLKILGDGEISNKNLWANVTVEAHAVSESARQKLDAAGLAYTSLS